MKIQVLLTLALVCLLSAGAAAAEDALIFRVSFDAGTRPEVGPAPARAEATAPLPGRLGQGIRVPVGAALGYDLTGKMSGSKGALALWIQAGVDFPAATAPAGRILHVHTREEGYFFTFLRLSQKKVAAAPAFELFAGDENDQPGSHGLPALEAALKWKAGEWHHLAFSWHRGKGVRVFHDGQEVRSTWGQEEWLPFTPTALYLNSHPNTSAQVPYAFDEVRVYAEPLSEQQVAALARGEDVQVARVAEEFKADDREMKRLRKELDSAGALPAVAWGKPTRVRQALPRMARLRKVGSREVTDGLPRTAVDLAAPLELEFATEEAINAVETNGTLVALNLAAGGQTHPVARPGKSARAVIPEVRASRLRLEPGAAGGRLSEVRLLHVGPAPESIGGIRCPLRRRAPGPAGVLPTLSTEALEAVPGGEPDGKGAAGPRVEIVTAPFAADTAVAGVRLDLRLAGPLPRYARVRLTESQEPDRSLLQADLRLDDTAAGAVQRLQLTLDWPDYIVRKGERVWASVLFDTPARLEPGSEMALETCPLEQARAQYAARQLGWFATWYSTAAEAHAWDSQGYKPDPELRWLENVRRFDPENPLALAYYNRIYHHTREVDVKIPGPERAPLWARAEREALRRTAEIVHWWIENRQTEDGQFGGNWNDDVEMMHGWDLVALAMGDRRVVESMGRLCDGIWDAGRFTGGYSNLIWDVEHAAEESSYSQPRMVLLDYGSPRWLERCMETTANFDFWTAVNARGHRHFKSYMFQAQKIRPTPETDSDVRDNARAMKPGNYVAWYNGNPQVVRWYREWADAWCEDALRTDGGKPAGVLPAEILPADCRLGREGSGWNKVKRYPLGEIAYHLEDELAAVAVLTGQHKYLAPIEAMAPLGQAGELAQANWRALTGDKQLDQRFVEKAKGAGLLNYLAWVATGDKSKMADACVETVRELERQRFLLTEAEPPTDRVGLPGNLLLRHMALGGPAIYVAGYPFLAVSWEGVGTDFAALVLPPERPLLEGPRRRLKVLAYNFGAEREVGLRLWQMEPGEYDLAVGVDANGDDAPDRAGKPRRVAVERGGRLPLRLPADALAVIELTLVKARPAGPRPDLGIGRPDVRLSADGRQVVVTVHSLGSAPAPATEVGVRDAGGQVVARGKCPPLEAPLDLQARTTEVTLALPADARAPLTVALDPGRALQEITRENNEFAVPAR